MKINRLFFENPNYKLEGEISFEGASLDPNHIKEIKPAKITLTGSVFDDLFVLNVDIVSEVIGVCSYTLQDVVLPIKIHDTINISNEVQDDEDLFYEPNNIFEIDPYIFSLILSSVPTKIIKKGAKLPESGNGYRVLTEDEYNKEEANKKDSRWDVLDNIEL